MSIIMEAETFVVFRSYPSHIEYTYSNELSYFVKLRRSVLYHEEQKYFSEQNELSVGCLDHLESSYHPDLPAGPPDSRLRHQALQGDSTVDSFQTVVYRPQTELDSLA